MWETGFGVGYKILAAFKQVKHKPPVRIKIMWETGFEPAKALSHWILSPVHLTALTLPHCRRC